MSSRRVRKLARRGFGPDGRESVAFDARRMTPRPAAAVAVTERPVPPQLRADHERNMALCGCEDRLIRVFALGDCSAIVTREFGRLHASIAHPRRDPTWGEIRAARDFFFPDDATVVQVLPPKGEPYVNAHAHCFHLWEIDPEAIAARRGPQAMNGGQP